MKLLGLLIGLTIFCSANAQWNAVNSVTDYQAIHHTVSEDTVYIAASGSQYPVIYRSVDGGQTLDSTAITSIQFSWLLDISFPSSMVGYACGGTAFGQFKSPILKTTDGGQSWDTLVTNRFGYELRTTHFIDDQTGFFGGQGIVVKTTDGGASFTSYPIANTVGAVEEVYFKDASTGFALVKESIYKTTDGGVNWTQVFQDTADHYLLYCIGLDFPQNGSTGFVINQQAELLKTVDNGNTWQRIGRIADTINASSIDFVDAQTGYFGSLDPNRFDRAGGIYRTDDGGQSWVWQYGLNPWLVQGPIETIGMVNAQVGYAMMGHQLLKTVDGGIGFQDFETGNSMQLFPNPARDHFRIQMEGTQPESVSLVDASGRNVRKWTPSQSYSLHGLAGGLYMVRVKSGSTYSVQRLLVQ
ncbi:MAG TPA: hypothetical protein DCG19_11335 [Cryomorphaceae bacterium]|nr:hypothetical protein [Owenweeksia sp.]MBG00254.1 hypothetical protein [Owenweeksia sp.]HAD97990.1 hypothetical protein [Cryomorphaceae bacterium]HBF20836.1 hypothetical protein [Cryomorphaceae bacterium]HCQ16892.1 hypothetical protein [Cryomorphaceae bacterium]|tara:strand:- start:21064 stop:22302 length:1239 start_codon:yes stop_codon:yes gene_type:complete